MSKLLEYIVDEIFGVVSYLNLAHLDKKWAEMVTSLAGFTQRVRNILNCPVLTNGQRQTKFCIFAAFVHFVTCLLFVCWFLFHTFNYFSFSTILTIHVFLHRISTSLLFLDNRFFGTILHFLLSSFAELQYAAVSNDYRIFYYYYYFFLFFFFCQEGTVTNAAIYSKYATYLDLLAFEKKGTFWV